MPPLSEKFPWSCLPIGSDVYSRAMSHIVQERSIRGNILDGAALSKTIIEEIKGKLDRIRASGKPAPGLAVILAGDNPASAAYVGAKQRACEKAGFFSLLERLPETVAESELLGLIARLNSDPKIHGILVQLPLPAKIDSARVMQAIDPLKDVDGFHPVNVGKLTLGEDGLAPCTAVGCIEILKRYNIPIKGKKALVLGRSNIVGKPTSMLLLKENATVTMAHSQTLNLADEVRSADILVAAIGKPEFVKGDWIKESAVVIDVGISSVPNPAKPGHNRLVGDVEFLLARERAGWITPVPGGVGPMTIAMLLQNTLKAWNQIVAKNESPQ